MEAPHNGKTRVLLIEDHPHMRRLLGSFVDNQPNLTLEAAFETAEAALEYINGNKPDFVLVDIALPGMNGIELIKELHTRFDGKVICLVVSGQAYDFYAEQAQLAGARGFVGKGDPEGLRLALSSVTGGGEYWQAPL